jgi:hypothetical protein
MGNSIRPVLLFPPSFSAVVFISVNLSRLLIQVMLQVSTIREGEPSAVEEAITPLFPINLPFVMPKIPCFPAGEFSGPDSLINPSFLMIDSGVHSVGTIITRGV